MKALNAIICTLLVVGASSFSAPTYAASAKSDTSTNNDPAACTVSWYAMLNNKKCAP
jgi:hypothetical protein